MRCINTHTQTNPERCHRYDQSLHFPSTLFLSSKQDQALWVMKAELLMLTCFLKIMPVVNMHVKSETAIRVTRAITVKRGRQRGN